MSKEADRGDMGAIPDRSWEERWSTWSIESIQAHIAGAARYGVLSKVQVNALLQGLPPPSAGADLTGCVLAECEAIVDRFWQDAVQGLVSKTPTPRELAAWADARGHGLPDPFLATLFEQGQSLNTPATGTAPGGGSISLPAWARILPSGASSTFHHRKAGRPRTGDASRQALVSAGRRVLVEAASKGNYLPLIEVAKQLEGTPVAAGKCATGIKRALSGQLDVVKAC